MKRCISLLLAFVMILALLPVFTSTTAQAASKRETKRIIGIVFDNSGSMYNNIQIVNQYGQVVDTMENKSWCQATYAMEVFASMLNNSDELRIYPMHAIQVDGKTYNQNNPLVIRGPGEASKIRNIYTPTAGGTPFSPVTNAFNDLTNASGFDEKHLIVLTDGADLDMSGTGFNNATDMLNKYSETMNQVMYLAIGEAAVELTSSKPNQFYDKASQTEDVLKKLTAMCNRIFGRHELDFSSGELTFDVSMSKIIIFAQGANVTGVNVDGMTQTSLVPMKYSTLGAGGRPNVVDTSLQGVIATYEGELDKGTYSVNFTGQYDSICVYYEPDVDIEVKMTGPDGPVDPSQELSAGDYTVEFCMVDREGDVVTSKLLGDVNYTVTTTINGEEKTYTFNEKSGSIPVTLNNKDTFDVEFVATYLGGYEIRKTGADFGWPSGGIQIQPPPAKDLQIVIAGGADTIPLSKLEEQAIFDIQFFYNGVQLTGAALERLSEPTVEFTGGNAKHELIRTESGYQFKILYNNSPAETQAVTYSLSVSASYTNEDDLVASCGPISRSITLEDDAGIFNAELVMDQDYYVATSIEKGKPIYINLTCGGKPLTPEQFQAAKVTVDMGGLPYEMTADEANSRYVIVLKEGEGLTNGRHDISMSAEGFDEFGRPISCKDSEKLEIQPYPQWVRWAFWILVILAVLLLIWSILNIKVLPKTILVDRSNFRVGSKEVQGDPEVNYSGGGKKKGMLEITPPYDASSPAASSCSITLELVAVSPLRVPSAKRYVGIRGAHAGDDANTRQMKFGGTTLVKNDEDMFVRMGSKSDTNVEEDVDSGFKVALFADVPGPRGRKVTVAFEAITEFR